MNTEATKEVIQYLKDNLKIYITTDERGDYTEIAVDIYIGNELINTDSVKINNR